MNTRSSIASVAAAILLAWTGCAAAIPATDSYETLLESAAKAIYWDTYKDWAFTETSSDSDGEFVGRYDPRLPEGERWTLISVDGDAPTEREIADFVAEKDNEREKPDDSDDNNDHNLDAMIEPGTLRLVQETDEYWLLSFIPGDDDEADKVEKKVMRAMIGKVKIIKDGEYLAFIDIRNEAPIKPKIGVKIHNFLTRLTFGPAVGGGPIVMKSMDYAIKLRAFLVIAVNESGSHSYSNFEYVGEAQ